MKLFGQLTKPVTKVATKAKANSPVIFLISGGICLGAAIITAHHAGRKVDDDLDVHKAQIDNLKEIKEAGS